LIKDPSICARYGEKCDVLKNTVVINRPAAIAGQLYNQISTLITNNITSLATTPGDIIGSLKSLDTQVDRLLNLKVSNFTTQLDLGAGIATVIRKIPSKMGTQFTILMIFMFGTIFGIFMYKRKTLNEKKGDLLSTTEKGFQEVKQRDHDDGLEKIDL